MSHKSFGRTAGIAAILIFLIAGVSGVSAYGPVVDDPSEETIIAKHLESIGSTEARKNLRSITVVGATKAVFRGRGTGETAGVVILASQAEKYLIGMKFNNPEYPHERLGYDGDDFVVAQVPGGRYTTLGGFLRNNEKSFEIGIIGGALSTAWELNNYRTKRGKLKCGGSEKIDGREAFECDYRPRKGSDMKIKLFFDKETFRHVRTEFSRVIAARQGTSVDNSARQSEDRYTLVEDFRDFKEENGLTLPHTYVIYLEMLTGSGTASYQWDMDLQRFLFNNEIDPKEFKVDSY